MIDPVLYNIRKNIVVSVIITVLLFAFFTVGLMLVQSWGVWDSFFMMILNITGAGGDISKLNVGGQVCVVLLLIFGCLFYGYVTSIFIMVFSYYGSKKILENVMEQRVIDSLNKHVVLCGFSQTGRIAAEKIKGMFPNKIVVIDNNVDLEPIVEAGGFLFLFGDACDKAVLEKAGISRAAFVIVTLPEVEKNVLCVFIVRKINSLAKIITKIGDHNGVSEHLTVAGADYIINPYDLGGGQIRDIIKNSK